VATSAYLAAVYLSADAARLGERELERSFRVRALIAGVAAGALAIAGLLVLRSDAAALYHRLVARPGLPALVISIVAGVLAVALVWQSKFELARYTAALAVAAIIAGLGAGPAAKFPSRPDRRAGGRATRHAGARRGRGHRRRGDPRWHCCSGSSYAAGSIQARPATAPLPPLWGAPPSRRCCRAARQAGRSISTPP